MKFPLLFRRRSVVLPTLVGWLVILVVIGLVAGFLFRNMAIFLTVNEPVGAEYLVVEGWMDKEELDQALEYFNTHDFAKAILVGGPISNDFHEIDTIYAERGANYLQAQGLPAKKSVIVKVPYSPQNRSFLNAVMVREWFKLQGISLTRLDVFSSSVHTRRSRDLYRLAFGEQIEIGIIASEPRDFTPAHWWKSNDRGKGVAVEFAGWFLVKCCFYPGELESHLENIGIETTAPGGD
jgi:hypothetical protein